MSFQNHTMSFLNVLATDAQLIIHDCSKRCILCLWFHASLSILIIVQRDATQAVYLLFCKFTLHVSGVNHTCHQEYTKL